MRPFSFFRICLLAFICFSFFACSDKKEVLDTEPVTDFVILQPGKYITYRLDSLVFVDFQKTPETHHYEVKHVVDAAITDNLGRPAYRIYRYIRAVGADDWNANGSYLITAVDKQIELTEDNLRFIKLHGPIREGFNWKGNSYLPTDPYGTFGYNFSNDDDMPDWNYRYFPAEATFTYEGETYNDVITVEQEDDSSNIPVTDEESYGYKTRSVEKYAKNIGLVYRQYELWEYQPNLSGPDPYYIGFGVTMWMIDHN